MKTFVVFPIIGLVTVWLMAEPAAARPFGWLTHSPAAHFTDEDWEMLRRTARGALDDGALERPSQ